jgi:hypothetical protein
MFFKINLTAGEVFLSTLNRVWPVLRSKSGLQLTVFRYEEYMVKGIYHTAFFVEKVNLFFFVSDLSQLHAFEVRWIDIPTALIDFVKCKKICSLNQAA